MKPLRVAVVGYGYWGPNLVRTLRESPEARLVAVAERNPARAVQIQEKYPDLAIASDHLSLFDMNLDAVAIVTSPETHSDLAAEFLQAGLDVFVEKPLAISTTDAARLVATAEENDRILMVGHIAEYHPAVRAIKQLIDAGDLGEIRYIDTVRAGLGLFHPSLNVMWDLAPHDLSILIHLLGTAPMVAAARGISCVQESIEDVAYATFTFPKGVLAHTRMSWLDPHKTRRITVVGSDRMIVYDDLNIHEQLKIYDKKVKAVPITDTFGDYQFSYHYGSVTSPYVEFEEPLRLECRHFLQCVRDRVQPLTDGRNGLRVVQAIEAAQRSLASGGVEVAVDSRSPAETILSGPLDYSLSNGTEAGGHMGTVTADDAGLDHDSELRRNAV